jgi:mannose-6-phosphate isomerase-like protein (cupin superfamily)
MADLERPLDPERDRWFLGTLDSIVAKAADTNGAYGVILRIAPRGFTPPHHQHSREDTGFLVLDGRVTMRVGDVEVVLGPNEYRVAPRGIPLWFRVETETARFLEIVSPGGFEGFHMEVSVPAERFEIPPADVPKPSHEEISKASSRFGTTVFKKDTK